VRKFRLSDAGSLGRLNRITRDKRRTDACFHVADAAGRVADHRRIDLYRQYLAELARAIADGARVRAYHAWKLTDDFEWQGGFAECFGLTYVDFETQKRTVKDSGRRLECKEELTTLFSP
jgi:beta-glucosidase/6-phospho-beta-glucosidase/beta-galactosidase